MSVSVCRDLGTEHAMVDVKIYMPCTEYDWLGTGHHSDGLIHLTGYMATMVNGTKFVSATSRTYNEKLGMLEREVWICIWPEELNGGERKFVEIDATQRGCTWNVAGPELKEDATEEELAWSVTWSKDDLARKTLNSLGIATFHKVVVGTAYYGKGSVGCFAEEMAPPHCSLNVPEMITVNVDYLSDEDSPDRPKE